MKVFIAGQCGLLSQNCPRFVFLEVAGMEEAVRFELTEPLQVR